MSWRRLLSELRFPFRHPEWFVLSLVYSGILHGASLRADLFDVGDPFWILTAGVVILLSPIYHAMLLPGMIARRCGAGEITRETRSPVESTLSRLIVGELMVNGLVIAGALVFLLPGIYLGVRLAFYKHEIIAQDRPTTLAIRESFGKTREGRMALLVFGALGVCYGAAFGIDALLLGAATAPWLIHAGSIAVSTMLLVYVNSFITALYCARSQRQAQHGS